MQKIRFPLFALLLAALSVSGQNNWRTKISPEVMAALNRGETVDFFLIFKEKADFHTAQELNSKSERAHYVFSKLQETADRSQANARRILRERGASANSLFLVNAIAVSQGNAGLARELAELQEVSRLAADPWVQFDGPVSTRPMTHDATTTQARNGAEWGLNMINAPAVWALGYTGQGITVGGADTGFDWIHPAIQPHYRGWQAQDSSADHAYNWHDAIHVPSPLNSDSLNPCGFNSKVPCDDNNHGTHTMGTMTGDDGQGNQIGVAPGAKWVACRNMERGWGKPSSYIECFQWFLAPTDLNGQNPNPDKSPDVVNNSWYCSIEEGCTDPSVNELIHQAVIALKASGVFVVISNGNFGPKCASTSFPAAYFEESFSVGSTRSDDSISSFSSRGPVLIDSSFRVKPNVAAPGQDVRSCIRHGDYATWSGTSMAGPHVVGLVALVLSARPDLAGQVELLENIIEQTAIPKTDTTYLCGGVEGSARPNQAFGWGRVDALAAVQAALLIVPVAEPSPARPVVAVSPNPVREEAVFHLKNMSGKSVLEVLNASGQLLFSKKWTAQPQEILRISMKDQSAGIYFYRLQSENGSASGKLIVE